MPLHDIPVGRIAAALLLGTAALVVWGMVFWAVLYDPLKVYGDLPDGVRAAVQVLKADGTATGTYFYPWPRNTPQARRQWIQSHRAGPYFELRYVSEGVDPQSPAKLLLGVAHYLVVAAIALGLCLLWVRSFGPRNILPAMLLAGCMGSILDQLSGPVWFALPWRSPLILLGYDLVAWILLGSAFSILLRQSARRGSQRA
jgi:hypothetical protein